MKKKCSCLIIANLSGRERSLGISAMIITSISRETHFKNHKISLGILKLQYVGSREFKR
jgi:hypothetical protein